MDIFNLLNQTLVNFNENIMPNVAFNELDYASVLSDTWKTRAKTCRINLHTCLNQRNKYLQYLSEQENEDYRMITKEIDEIDIIHNLIKELDNILVDFAHLPLSTTEVTKIVNSEIYVYNQFMNEENRKRLLDEINEEDRKIKLLNELIADVDTMWDNNDSEEIIKNHIYEKSKEIYLNRNDEEIRNISEDFFHYVTRGKPVRVALSSEQINKLKHENYHKNDAIRSEETCGTCLEEFLNHETTIILSCSHRFHSNCIVPWLKRSVFCPTCRKDLREP